MPDDPENSGAKQDGRFTAGRSGNPAGKPRGTRNRALAALDKIGAEAAADVLQATVAKAKGGDVRAAELVLSRAWPARKGRPVTLALPALETAADLARALGVVTRAVAAGTLTPDEGQAVAAILELHRRALDTAEIEARLVALETGISIR